MAVSLKNILELCKRRGFLYPSAEIYGCLKGSFDYGPLGVEMKRNIANHWWMHTVKFRDDVVGLDSCILTPQQVLQASGHESSFTDLLVDCTLTKSRFRPDKAPAVETEKNFDTLELPLIAKSASMAKEWEGWLARQYPGLRMRSKGNKISIELQNIVEPNSSTLGSIYLQSTSGHSYEIPYRGYVEPESNSPFLTLPRNFNLMFKTSFSSVDSSSEESIDNNPSSTVYLRPETAQGIFTNYNNVKRTSNPHLPFGIAQIGKAFRNEIRPEHGPFRTPEFEQMELEYFSAPHDSGIHFEKWVEIRFEWWKSLLRRIDDLRTRKHLPNELAHYAQACVDMEYRFPWGWGEVEGVAQRGSYDLDAHSLATGMSPGCHPHVIESSCGLNRALLAILFDAYEVVETSKAPGERIILRINPQISPFQVAVMPLMPKHELVPVTESISISLRRKLKDMNIFLDCSGNLKIGKRYYRQDEIGTPWCVTVDYETLDDNRVTVRDRDTTTQVRVHLDELHYYIREKMDLSASNLQ